MTLLEKLNKEDLFANSIGVRLTEVRPGYARAEMKVEQRHLNGGGVCQGGAIFTLADLTFAAVANCHGVLTLGICNTITFLRSGQLGDTLVAECTELFDHHRLPYCQITVSTSEGVLVACATGQGYRMNREMPFEGLM